MKQFPIYITVIALMLRAKASSIRFKNASAGKYVRRKGYAFVKDGTEILTLEPTHYSNGDKWLVTGQAIGKGVHYFKSTAKIKTALLTNKP